ncbi:MAG: prolipoprotein diacylglyceryl transferase [candidate division KSB1 bacterium]|nr:prolipoprotein diacylglyceryl transferase [candidate division KSB1 bacterium]MDZ7346645.1 prolipoprotein diacylglyceryl transferase [candidate division KSB1 bacterium]
MYPVLFKIGAFELRSYGLALAVSFLLGILISLKRAQKANVDQNTIMDLSVLMIISAIIGSRLLYVLFHLDEFRGRWLDTISPIQSNGQIGLAGLSVMGGIIFCFITAFIYLRIKKKPFFKIADVMIPTVGLGIFITRIGCFLNGCCFGLPCNGHHPICVTFPLDSPAGGVFPNQPLIPTQLYSSLYGLMIFGLLLWAERYKWFDGFLFSLFLILYGISRFTIDIFRYYEESTIVLNMRTLGLTINQLLSIAFIVAGVGIIVANFNLKKMSQSG